MTKKKTPPKQRPGSDGWWTTREVCEFARVGAEIVAGWCRAGRLTRYVVDGRKSTRAGYRYCVREVREFVAGLMQPAGDGGQ